MPSVSQAQNRAMEAAAHGNSSLGIPQSVGAEFTGAQPPGSVSKLPPRAHSLAMASATNLHKMGHISKEQHDGIHRVSRAALDAHHRMKAAMPLAAPSAPPQAFGALAPPMPGAGGPMGGQGGY